jgi:hypothetical protein
MKRSLLPTAAAVLLAFAPAAFAADTYEITVRAGKTDRPATPIRVPLTLTAEQLKAEPILTGPDGKAVACQVTMPCLLAEPQKAEGARELNFIAPPMKASETLKLMLTLGGRPSGAVYFRWADTPGDHTDLLFGDRPVLRYMYHALDDSTPQKREETFKVYHHVFTPDGSRLATKGVGGLYTHHRGLFYGFMKVTYGDNHTVDIWHCKNDTYQGHEKVLRQEAGPVLGRHRLLLGWHGDKKELFANEERELTAYAVPGGTLIDFTSKVTPVKGTMKVDGDPQHAGFHFRADNEVDKNKAQTIYIRPDGIGEAGKERNYPADKAMVNLPWNGMSFVVGDKRYTTAYLDHPTNPKEARYSERTYGRFGSYFVAEATPEKPLVVRYRVWLQDGQMKPEQIAALSAAFVDPPQVTVEKK